MAIKLYHQTLRLAAFLCLIGLAATACTGQPETTSIATPVTPTSIPATPATSNNGNGNGATTPVFEIPEPTAQPKTRLIIWLPPEIASRTEAGAVVFSDQLLAFNNAYPELEISVEQKPVGGQGGSLNYLRTGKGIAPTILPDLIAIPVSQITAVSDEGLIFPLEDVIDTTTLDELYPVAKNWANHSGHTFAYPFAITELPQLEYSSTITQTTPVQWQTFITNTNRTFVLPATGSAGAKLALQFYLEAGGALENEAGQDALELEPLILALKQFADGRQTGFIRQQSSNITTVDEARLLVQNGTADYALSASDEYLKGRTEEIFPGFAAIPGLDDSPTPLVRGWAWAITTSDPAERAAAAALINTLTTPENLGNWSLNSEVLPANPIAFDQWPTNDTYVTFAHEELARAASMPKADNSALMKTLGNAVFDVISLSKTPEAAAAEAVASLQP